MKRGWSSDGVRRGVSGDIFWELGKIFLVEGLCFQMLLCFYGILYFCVCTRCLREWKWKWGVLDWVTCVYLCWYLQVGRWVIYINASRSNFYQPFKRFKVNLYRVKCTLGFAGLGNDDLVQVDVLVFSSMKISHVFSVKQFHPGFQNEAQSRPIEFLKSHRLVAWVVVPAKPVSLPMRPNLSRFLLLLASSNDHYYSSSTNLSRPLKWCFSRISVYSSSFEGLLAVNSEQRRLQTSPFGHRNSMSPLLQHYHPLGWKRMPRSQMIWQQRRNSCINQPQLGLSWMMWKMRNPRSNLPSLKFTLAVSRIFTNMDVPRSKRLVDRISPFVETVQRYGSALNVLSNTFPLIMAPLWGGIRIILYVYRQLISMLKS